MCGHQKIHYCIPVFYVKVVLYKTIGHLSCVPPIFVLNHRVKLDYHITQIFGRGKPWQNWQITGGLANFTIQILTMSHGINKANKQEFTKGFLHQTFTLYGNLRNSPQSSNSTKSSPWSSSCGCEEPSWLIKFSEPWRGVG